MKNAKVQLLIGAICGAVTLAGARLQAQTLPVTNGLQLWLVADTGVTTNSSGQVTAWADQSGQGNNATQSTPANAPTLALNSLNGHATLRVINPQYMEVPNAGAIATLTNDVTLLWVAKYDDLNGYRGVVDKCVAGFPAPFDIYANASQSGGRTRLYLNNGTASNPNFYSTIAPPVGIYHVLGFRWKDGVADQFQNDFSNGTLVYTGNGTNGSTNLRIGQRAGGTVQLVGNVAEILLYQPALANDAIFNTVTSYLQPKYALTFDIPPVVSVTSPTNGATAAASTPIPVSISASDADGYVTRVSVYGNGVLLGTGNALNTNSSSTYQLDVTGPAAGLLALTAVATDNYGRTSTSAPVVVTIPGDFATNPVAAGLRVWLAADAGVTTNLSGAVTNWADQSGNGNDGVQANEPNAPLVAFDALNGKPALRFNGTPQFLEVSDAGTAFTTNDLATFAVAKFVGSYPAVRQHVWSKCNTNAWAAPVDWWFNTGTGVPFGYRGDGTTNFAGTGGGTLGPVLEQYTIVGMTVTGSNGVMAHSLGFADNGISTALTNTASAGLPLRIGRRAEGGTQIKGDIAELLIYDQALSASDRSNVVSYLSGKYNLMALRPVYASPPPVVAITTPTNGTTFAAPALSVSFSATASSANGAITRVILSANGQQFGSFTNAPYTVPLDLLTPGTVTFTAVAQDNWGVQSSTSIVATVTGSASTPLVTDGLRLQLAADLGVTTNAVGAVTAWNDQSPSAYVAAPTNETASPILVENTLNGKPVLRFSGGTPGQFLEVPGDTSFTAGDISSFAMVKFNNFTNTPAPRGIWSKTKGNNLAAPTDWYFASSSGASTVYRGNGATGGYGSSAGGAAPAGVFAVVGFKASGQAITHYLVYNSTGAGNITQTPVDAGYSMRIGRRYDTGVQMNGDIAEILIYDHAVSDADRRQIVDYLNNKWGITVVQVADVPPTVLLKSPTNAEPVSAPGVLSVVAQVTPGSSSIVRVDFLANGWVVASRTAAPYQIPLQVLSPGPLTLQVQAVDFWGAVGTSAPVVLTVAGSGPAAPPSAGQVLWLKADAGVTTNMDGTVVSWADQSGNANDAIQDQIYFYPTPVLVTDGTTGQPALNYDGTTRYLLVSNAPSLALVSDLSIFFAANIDDFAAIRSICGKTTLNQPHPFDYYVNTSARAVFYRGDTRGNASVPSSGSVPAGTNVVCGVTVATSVATHYLQSMVNGTGSLGYGAVDDGTDLLIGSRDARDIYFKGNLSEIMLYDHGLSASDLQLVNTYLAAKYGIATFQLSTQPPSLTVTKTGASTIQLSWLPGYAGFILEGRTNIASGAWTPIATNPPNNQVTLGTTNVARFFRLRSQ